MSPPVLFDRALLARRRRRFAGEFAQASFLHARVAADIAERLSAVSRAFPLALDLGSGTRPLLAEALMGTGKVGRVVVLDRLAQGADGVIGDEEMLPFADARFDLVASSLSLHAVNDLPGAFARVKRALKPDGLFLASLLAGGTLGELREAFLVAESEVGGASGVGPRVAPFAELKDLGALLQRGGFALPVVDIDTLTVRYAHPLGLMRDLRAMGFGNVLVERTRRPLRRDVLTRMIEVYAERFADADGRVRATFNLASLSGWAPHESQQKPLAPGSARMRLADALAPRVTDE